MRVWDAFPQKTQKQKNKMRVWDAFPQKTQNKIQNKKPKNKTKILIEYVNNFSHR